LRVCTKAGIFQKTVSPRARPPCEKSGFNMTLTPSPDIIYVMVSYIENRGIEKYLLIFVFFYYFKIYGLIPRRSAAVKAVEKKKKKL
jgi:hypothetical protein